MGPVQARIAALEEPVNALRTGMNNFLWAIMQSTTIWRGVEHILVIEVVCHRSRSTRGSQFDQ